MSDVTLVPVPIQVPENDIVPASFVYNGSMVGATDGINGTFTLPSSGKYLNDLGVTIQVMINNVKQLSGFIPNESGGTGTGFNQIIFTPTVPMSGTTITADYIVSLT